MQRHVCPFDNAVMREEEVSFSVVIKGVDVAISGILQCVCPTCGSKLVPLEMLRANTRRVADVKRAHMGLLSGAEIARIREKVLGLSRYAASQRFGLGRNAFYKYEEEGQLQSQPTDKLLRALNHSPNALAALRSSDRSRSTEESFASKTSEIVEASTDVDLAPARGPGSVTYIRDYKMGAR